MGKLRPREGRDFSSMSLCSHTLQKRQASQGELRGALQGEGLGFWSWGLLGGRKELHPLSHLMAKLAEPIQAQLCWMGSREWGES